YTYHEVVTEGIFDVAVGDVLRVTTSAAEAGHQTIAQSSFFIDPIGGPKGDPGPQGPDATLAQSSHAYLGVSAGPITNGAWNTLGWLAASPPGTFINGFTFGTEAGIPN